MGELEEEGRGDKPKVNDDEDFDGKLDSMKDIFSDESDLDDFEYESFPFFEDKKNHLNNGDEEDKDDEEFNPIQMRTANAAFPPMNRSNCGIRIASLLREICYDRFAPLNGKIWEDMRGLETLSGLTALLLRADVKCGLQRDRLCNRGGEE